MGRRGRRGDAISTAEERPLSSASRKAKAERTTARPTAGGRPARTPDGGGAFDFIHFFSNDKVRREYVEMVAFVLVLVCFLRMFGAEAYVIPTGSMATTLLGAYKSAACPECGAYTYVNASEESERDGYVRSGLCENCVQPLEFRRGDYHWGDRILADKLVYELREPRRWEVAVFKYPNGVDRRPSGVFSARTNYIKRVVGLPGETVGIQYGDVFAKRDGESEFQIQRKPARVVLATRRLVYDNDRPPADLADQERFARWSAEDAAWKVEEEGRSFRSQRGGEGWLAYRHLLRPFLDASNPQPSLILDFEAYDTNRDQEAQRILDHFRTHWRGMAKAWPHFELDFSLRDYLGSHWVGDLMIECDVRPESAEGEFVLELVEGNRVFRCRFDLQSGEATLLDGETKLASATAPLRAGRTSRVGFANVDDQLLVWIDGALAFHGADSDGVVVEPPAAAERGPAPADLRPARVGAIRSEVRVSSIRLYRDVYYSKSLRRSKWLEPATPFWPLEAQDVESVRAVINTGGMRTFPLRSTEYLPLGDNSPASSDAREWENVHVVDRRLFLGRAVVRFWPVIAWEGGRPSLRWKFVE